MKSTLCLFVVVLLSSRLGIQNASAEEAAKPSNAVKTSPKSDKTDPKGHPDQPLFQESEEDSPTKDDKPSPVVETKPEAPKKAPPTSAETANPLPPNSSSETKNLKPEPSLSDEELHALQSAITEDTTDSTQKNAQPLAPPALLDISTILDIGAGFYSTFQKKNAPERTEESGHNILASGFRLQQLELALGANVDPYFRFDANLVFTPDEGVEIEEAYGTSMTLPGNLQVKFGQFKSKFGRQNLQHLHQWTFINQPLILRKFFGVDGARGLGSELSWLTPLPWYVEFSAAVNTGQGRSFAEDRAIKYLTDLVYTTKVDQLFAFSENTSLDFGIAAKAGPNDSGEGLGTMIGAADFYLRYKPVDSEDRMALSWTTELMIRSRKLDKRKVDYGGYTQLIWNIDQRWETGARYEYLSGLTGDTLDPDWTKGRQIAAIQGTFYPSHFSKIRVQTLAEITPDQPINFGALLSIELNSGVHGAHNF